MKKKLLFAFFLSYFVLFNFLHAQVGIGTTNPSPSSALHVSSTSKGVLLPKVTLVSKYDITTVPSPTDGLLIYNTNETTDVPDHLTKGYYCWSSSSNSWERVGSPRSYGSFISTADQQVELADKPYPVKFDINPLFNSGITIVDNSTIRFDKPGLYNLQLYLQFQNRSTTKQQVGIWLRQNGVDVENSTIYISIPVSEDVKISTNVSSNFLVSVNPQVDHVEIMWTSRSDEIFLSSIPAVFPAPASPSVKLTIDQVK